jgi:hypothetical protein
MEEILIDSNNFTNLKKIGQTKYIEQVLVLMEQKIGVNNTKKVMFECGINCCGKSWSKFAKRIYNTSKTIEGFIHNLNKEEKKYNTYISFDKNINTIQVKRTKCICGLINKGNIFSHNNLYCSCSNGHMHAFFNSVFTVGQITLEQSIYSGNESCVWQVSLKE